jgi:hypothetical protein
VPPGFVRWAFWYRSADSRDRSIDMLSVHMSIPKYHNQRLVTADFLDSRQINPSLHKGSNRGVTHYVRGDEFWFEPGALDAAPQRPPKSRGD